MYNSAMTSLANRLQAADALLAPYAVLHSDGLGRIHEEAEDDTRFRFQRDRGRIVHTQAFRRLKGKTQVFVGGGGDHYRTRLTHTLEVAGISRDLARTLQLNEDLAECIALAHDLGHPPFGHTGEERLNNLMQEVGGFDHNFQTLKLVTILERQYANFSGLNLCFESLDGIVKHNGPIDEKDKTIRLFWDENIALGEGGGEHHLSLSPSLEAQVASLSDDIAYCAHDIADGHEAGILSYESLRTSPFFGEFLVSEQPREYHDSLSVGQGCRDLIRSVSYTHLTLPTIGYV